VPPVGEARSRPGSTRQQAGSNCTWGFLDVDQSPVPTFTEPALSPRSRPDLADEFPLVLTCAKSLYFCETQHRQVASLRRHVPDPEVELHPDTAAERRIAEGEWVEIADAQRGASEPALHSTERSLRASCAASTAGSNRARSSTCRQAPCHRYAFMNPGLEPGPGEHLLSTELIDPFGNLIRFFERGLDF
jgi:Molydopterin dinucleotide binding domain